jgi:uncharacterized protein
MLKTSRDPRKKRPDKQDYRERTYRSRLHPSGLSSFRVAVKESDLWVSAECFLENETLDLLLACRHQLETYILSHPSFKTSLAPEPMDPLAPPVVRTMMEAASTAKVGPMATVAGTLAQEVGVGLLRFSREVIVENGGDVFLKAERPLTVSIFAGDSPLSEKVGLRIEMAQMPLGVCTSSGKIGHSLSLGKANAVTLLAPSAALADGAATFLANRVREKRDLEKVAALAGEIPGLLGGVMILDGSLVSWGDVQLVTLP